MKAPHGYDQVELAIRSIKEHIERIRALKSASADEISLQQALIAKTKHRLHIEIQPHIEAISEAMKALTRWYSYPRNLNRYARGRKIVFPSGTLSGHMSSSFKVEVIGNENEVISRVIAEKGDKYITYVPSLNREAILADREEFRNFEGIKITIKDNVTLNIDNFELNEKTEQPLLTAPRRVWINPKFKPTGVRPKSSD